MFLELLKRNRHNHTTISHYLKQIRKKIKKIPEERS
jgi:hypothetical protein